MMARWERTGERERESPLTDDNDGRRTQIHTQTQDEANCQNMIAHFVSRSLAVSRLGAMFFFLLLLCLLRRMLLFFFAHTAAAATLQRNFLPFIAHIFFSCAFFFSPPTPHQWSNFRLLGAAAANANAVSWLARRLSLNFRTPHAVLSFADDRSSRTKGWHGAAILRWLHFLRKWSQTAKKNRTWNPKSQDSSVTCDGSPNNERLRKKILNFYWILQI